MSAIESIPSSKSTPPLSILLVDTQDHTARVLLDRIASRGHRAISCGATRPQVQVALEGGEFDAFILDFHYDRPHDLEACLAVRQLRPALPVIVLASPGLALQRVRAWNQKVACVDETIRKPLDGEALFRTLHALVQKRRADSRARSFANLVSEEGRNWVEHARTGPMLSEHAILFTDIRRSTQLISSLPLPRWFDAINRSLSDQGAAVREAGGSVVKYTGDGMLASFRGRGRSHQALRCAIALQELDATSDYRDSLRVGIGLAEGLVMTGLIGEPGRQQYDVIGATVHLAARLCAIAEAGEIVATPRLVRSAGMTGSMPPESRTTPLRGFDAPVEYVCFPSTYPRKTSGTEP